MYYLPKNLVYLRNQAGLSQAELSKKLGMKSKSTVAKYEKGDREPSMKIASQLADIFRVTLHDLVKTDLKKEADNLRRYSSGNAVSIPVLGRVAAGIPLEEIEDIIDYEQVPIEMVKGSKYFALRIKGDSMSPMIEDGDDVICRAQSEVENGEIAIVTINGADGCCKKFYKRDGAVTLKSINPDYQDMKFDAQTVEALPIHVVGKVKEIRRSL